MNKEIEDYIKNIIKKYVPILRLQRHTFDIEYNSSCKDSIMEYEFRYPYLTSKITYSDKAIELFKNGEDLTNIVLHELCHALTDPLYFKASRRYIAEEDLDQERELLTDYICNIVLGLTTFWGGTTASSLKS